jgi:glycosyltransferase involved in cell wall biosynthesis
MKVVAFIDTPIHLGGGEIQAFNAIRQLAQICEDAFDFEVATNIAENMPHLKRLGISSYHLRIGFLDQLLPLVMRSRFYRLLPRRPFILGPFEKALLHRNADIVIFVSSPIYGHFLQQLKFVTTVWDLCHRDFPEFPEVSRHGEFHHREYHYTHNLADALLVLTDSPQLSQALIQRYGLDPERILSMPYWPSPFLAMEHSLPTDEVLAIYNLKPGYYFYPAQFWAHKNHARIIEALQLLRDRDIRPRCVFCGKDYGTRTLIEKRVNRLNLADQISILDFVPQEHVRGLYLGSDVIIMPTYFGPTNIPPLEAWLLDRPLIYSKLLSEHAGDAALLVDPDDPHSLVSAMLAIHLPGERERLIESGRRRFMQLANESREAEREIKKRLQSFEARLRCWQ